MLVAKFVADLHSRVVARVSVAPGGSTMSNSTGGSWLSDPDITASTEWTDVLRLARQESSLTSLE